MAKTVTNILYLSPTHFVSNIRHLCVTSLFSYMIGTWGVDIEESNNFILIYIVIFAMTYAVTNVSYPTVSLRDSSSTPSFNHRGFLWLKMYVFHLFASIFVSTTRFTDGSTIQQYETGIQPFIWLNYFLAKKRANG